MQLTRLIILLITLTLRCPAVLAELKAPKIFGGGMIIQRDRPIHVWGSAASDCLKQTASGSPGQ
jgi:hypothetical protein